MYNNKKKAPFVNLKLELSEPAAYARDTASILENLKYLNLQGTNMENKDLIEAGSTFGSFDMFPGDNVIVCIDLYPELTILKGTAAMLNLQNPQSGTYQLFGSPIAALPIAENTSGNFSTGNLLADTIVYVKVKTGLCESEQTAIHIKVVDETRVFVPTGFSPNGDGKNDIIRPKVFGMLQLEFFTIYNRWGEVVFTTKDLMKGWNGYYNQLPAPGGVYI